MIELMPGVCNNEQLYPDGRDGDVAQRKPPKYKFYVALNIYGEE